MQSIMAVGTCDGGVIHLIVMTEHREEDGKGGHPLWVIPPLGKWSSER